jgi:kinesin family protein 18/19
MEIREDPIKGIIISNMTEVIASSVSEVMTLLRIGNKNRSTEATDANDASSRSHAVL